MSASLFKDIPTGETITAITPLVSNPNLRSIRVGKRVAARLMSSDITDLKLSIGDAWTDEISDRVTEIIFRAKTRKAALQLLARRGFSVAELHKRLTERGFDSSAVDFIIDELIEDGWLDDQTYAHQVAESVLARGPASARLIIAKLHDRLIEDCLAQHVADEILSGIDATEAATTLARQELARRSHLDRSKAAAQTARLLSRRGYDDSTIHTALHRARVMEPETFNEL